MRQKTTENQKSSRTFGIIFIVLPMIVLYVVSLFIVTSDSFYDRTGGGFETRETHELIMYLLQMLSIISPVLFYVSSFNKVANADLTKCSILPIPGKPYIYEGWHLKAILGGGFSGAIIAAIIFLIGFHDYYSEQIMFSNLMIWVWVIQFICGTVAFYIPAFKPTTEKD